MVLIVVAEGMVAEYKEILVEERFKMWEGGDEGKR